MIKYIIIVTFPQSRANPTLFARQQPPGIRKPPHLDGQKGARRLGKARPQGGLPPQSRIKRFAAS